jgi:hypothetical protein
MAACFELQAAISKQTVARLVLSLVLVSLLLPTCLMNVLLPPMLGPVMMLNQLLPRCITQSLDTNDTPSCTSTQG